MEVRGGWIVASPLDARPYRIERMIGKAVGSMRGLPDLMRAAPAMVNAFADKVFGGRQASIAAIAKTTVYPCAVSGFMVNGNYKQLSKTLSG